MNEVKHNVFVVLHNVHAVSKVMETAQVVYGLGFRNFVVSRAEGSAAQTGVPDANRMALRMKRTFMVLPSLQDVIELLEVERPLLVVSPVLTRERLDLAELSKTVNSDKKTVIVLSGSNSSFSRKEMDLGECKSLDAHIDIGAAGTASIILYSLLKNQ
ncbi:MAG: RecB-family nuclease [Candidatus Thorarchaeota archaeon]